MHAIPMLRGQHFGVCQPREAGLPGEVHGSYALTEDYSRDSDNQKFSLQLSSNSIIYIQIKINLQLQRYFSSLNSFLFITVTKAMLTKINYISIVNLQNFYRIILLFLSNKFFYKLLQNSNIIIIIVIIVYMISRKQRRQKK